MAHPTRFERVTFAFGGQMRMLPIAELGIAKPRYDSFMGSTADEIEGVGQNLDEPRSDSARDWTTVRWSGATAICPSSRLMALLSVMAICGTGFCRTRNAIF